MAILPEMAVKTRRRISLRERSGSWCVKRIRGGIGFRKGRAVVGP
jgi:hypothetical protein